MSSDDKVFKSDSIAMLRLRVEARSRLTETRLPRVTRASLFVFPLWHAAVSVTYTHTNA